MDHPDHSGSGRAPALSAELLGGLVAARKSPRPQTLRGLVRNGVERGAVVLLDDGGMLLAQLMGGDPTVLADGARVEVTGVFWLDLSTTVQQGPPFRVDSATTLDTPTGR
jgi:hypothetical protein